MEPRDNRKLTEWFFFTNKQIKGSSNKLERYIHFWLGTETTQDEAGVVAIKAVELDDFLGGSPVQQREVEGSESARFMTYFKDGIRYNLTRVIAWTLLNDTHYVFRILPGGAASGFKHVTDEFHPALYSVKGKRNPVVRQLAEVSWSLMNEGDVFVLDCKKYIFVWVGRSANSREKMHAAKVWILFPYLISKGANEALLLKHKNKAGANTEGWSRWILQYLSYCRRWSRTWIARCRERSIWRLACRSAQEGIDSESIIQ